MRLRPSRRPSLERRCRRVTLSGAVDAPMPKATPFAVPAGCEWRLLAERAAYCAGHSEALIGCEETLLPVHACKTEAVRAIRIGPVQSAPQRWHHFATAAMSSIVETRDCYDAYVGHAVEERSGLSVGLPPLHLHHIHVNQQCAAGDHLDCSASGFRSSRSRGSSRACSQRMGDARRL